MMQNESKTKRKTISVQEMMKRLAESAKSANNKDADDSDLLYAIQIAFDSFQIGES